MSKNIDTPGIIHNIKAREELNNNGEIAKVKGRVDENPENNFIQHEIKSFLPFEDIKKLAGEDMACENEQSES